MDPELPDSFSWWCLKTIFGDYQVASADDSVRVSVILCQWVQWWVLRQVSPGESGGTAGDRSKDDLRGCQCVQWFPTCVMTREWNIWSGRSYSGSIMPKEPPANPHVSRFCFSFFCFLWILLLIVYFCFFFLLLCSSDKPRNGRRHWGSAAIDGDTAFPKTGFLLVPVLTTSQGHILDLTDFVNVICSKCKLRRRSNEQTSLASPYLPTSTFPI